MMSIHTLEIIDTVTIIVTTRKYLLPHVLLDISQLFGNEPAKNRKRPG